MDTKEMRLKVNHVKLLWLILPAMFLMVLGSCNSSNNGDGNKQELKKEVQDVKDELGEIAADKKQELKDEVNDVVDAFNKQIQELDAHIRKGGRKLDAQSEEKLKDLKAQRDKLKMKLNEIESQTKDSWDSFTEEVKHDSKQFGESVRDFFRDNK